MAEYGSWNLDITQQFIRPLIDNLIAVLQAGEDAVHAEVNSNVPMPVYKSWYRSRWVHVVQDPTTVFPTCSVIPRRSRTNKGEGGPSVDEVHVVEILIEDVGGNPDTLADNVMKRVQAAHIIIERAPLSALFNGFVPSASQRPHWDIEHDYRDFFNAQKSTYKQNGSLIITFTGLMEKT
jgi:hypothetical protein